MPRSRTWSSFLALAVLLGLLAAPGRGQDAPASPAEKAKKLVERLEQGEASWQVSKDMGDLGSEGVAAFVSLVAKGNAEVREAGIDALNDAANRKEGGIDASAIDVPTVALWLSPKEPEIQSKAFRLLGAIGTDAAAKVLAAKFPKASEGDRGWIRDSLGPKRPRPAALPFLAIAADQDQTSEIRLAALGVLNRLARSEAAEGLVALLADPSMAIRRDAHQALVGSSGRDDLAFEPSAAPTEREEAIGKWKKWLAVRKRTLDLDAEDAKKADAAAARLSSTAAEASTADETNSLELAWAVRELPSARGRKRAAEVLARHVEKPAESVKTALLKALDDDDKAVRAAAARTIGEGAFDADAGVKERLKRIFEQSTRPGDEDLRRAAAQGLYGLGDATAYAYAQRLLFHGDKAARQAALQILTGGGKKEIDLLLAFVDGKVLFPGTLPNPLLSGSDTAADLAAAAREYPEFARRVAGLPAAFAGDRAEERRKALEAIGAIGGNQAIRALLERVGSPDASVRQAALAGLVKLAEKAPSQHLAEFWTRFDEVLAGDKDPAARAQAARLLGSLRVLSASAHLVEAAGAEGAGLRAAAVGALGRIGDPTVAPVIEKGLEDKDPAVRRAAAGALAARPEDADVAKALAAFKAEKDAETRRALLELLAVLPDPDAADALADELAGDDATSRRLAARGLSDWLGHALEFDADGSAEERKKALEPIRAEVRRMRIATFLDRLEIPAAAPTSGDVDARLAALTQQFAADEAWKGLVALGPEAAQPIADRLSGARAAEVPFLATALAEIVRKNGWDEKARGTAATALAANPALDGKDALADAFAAEVLLADKASGAAGVSLLETLLPRLTGKRLAAAALRIVSSGGTLGDAGRERLLDLTGKEEAQAALLVFQHLGPGDGVAGVLRWVDSGDADVVAKALAILEGWKWPGTVLAVRDRLAARAASDTAARLTAASWALAATPAGTPTGALSVGRDRAGLGLWAERSAKRLDATDQRLLEIACASAPVEGGTLDRPGEGTKPVDHLDGWLALRRDLVNAMAGLVSTVERRRQAGRGAALGALTGPAAKPEARALALHEIQGRRDGLPETYRADLIAALAREPRAEEWDLFYGIARNERGTPAAAAAARWLRNLVSREDWTRLAPLIAAGPALDRLFAPSPGPVLGGLSAVLEKKRAKRLAELGALAASDDPAVRFQATQAIVWLGLPGEREEAALLPLLAGARGEAFLETLPPLERRVDEAVAAWRKTLTPEGGWPKMPYVVLPGSGTSAADLAGEARALAGLRAFQTRIRAKDELAIVDRLVEALLAFRRAEHPTEVRVQVYSTLQHLARELGTQERLLRVVDRAVRPGELAQPELGPDAYVLDAAVADLGAEEAEVRQAAFEFLRIVAAPPSLPEKASSYSAHARAEQRAEGEAAWREWLRDVRIEDALLEKIDAYGKIALESGESILIPQKIAEELGGLIGERAEVGRKLVGRFLPAARPSVRAALLLALAGLEGEGDVDLALAALDDASPAVRQAAAEALRGLTTTETHPKWLTTEKGEPPEFASGAAGPIELRTRADALRDAWKKETEARAKEDFLAELAKSRRTYALSNYRDLERTAKLSIDWLVHLSADERPEVRELVATGLGRLERSDESARTLVRLLEDLQPPVRKAAIQGLERLTGTRLDYDAEAGDRTKAVESWKSRVQLLDQPAEREGFYKAEVQLVSPVEARTFLDRLAAFLAPHRETLVDVYLHPENYAAAGMSEIDTTTRRANIKAFAADLLAETRWLPAAQALVETVRTGSESDRRVAIGALERMTGQHASSDEAQEYQSWLDQHASSLDKP